MRTETLSRSGTQTRRQLVFSRQLDLLLLIIFALLLPLITLLPAWLAALRIGVGIAVVLLLPGYALQAALFPGPRALDAPLRAALSFGLSVALIPLLALFLNWTPWGLRVMPITLVLAGCLLLLSLIALGRRWQVDAQIAQPPRAATPLQQWGTLRPAARITTAAGVVLVLLVIGLSLASFLLIGSSRYLTEFYMLGPAGEAASYPRSSRVGETVEVSFGIHNQERNPTTYRIEVWAVDPARPGQRQQLQSAGPFSLQVGETARSPLNWSMPWSGEDQKVEIYLFRDTDTRPYRQLELWLSVLPER